MIMEVWKNINIDFINRYEISSLGNIRTGEGRILSLPVGKRGYILKTFKKNKIIKTYSIHRIVAITFIPNPENKYAVNHINGIKTDNRLENLEWCTKSENEKHAHKMGLKVGQFLNKFGDKHVRSKPCIQISLDGFILNYFNGQHEAARETGIDVRMINSCIMGKRKRVNNYIFL